MSDMTDLRMRTVSGTVVAEGRARARITTFNDPYEYAPRVREEIAPNAFDGYDTIPVMYQHQHNDPPVGVATLVKDATGIDAEVQFFMDTERGRAAFNAYNTGAMKEWSVGFVSKPDEITTTRADGYVNERINSGRLLEVSTVLSGANKHTGTFATRADGMGNVGSNNHPGSAYGTDEGAAADGGRDPDTHETGLAPVAPSMVDAMAVMSGVMKQMNAAHAMLQKAHAGTEGGLVGPATDDDDDQGGPVALDSAAAPGAALRADYNTADRKTMAKAGTAMPDGSYPIANAADLKAAIHTAGMGNDPASAIHAHIVQRAKALGLESLIPADWANAPKGGEDDSKARGERLALELRIRALTRRVTSA